MKRVGIRELRKNASALLRLVERGTIIEVINRGRPVALLSPAPPGGPLNRMREAGLSLPARRKLTDLPQPIEVPVGTSPTELLRIQREGRLGAEERDAKP